MSFVFVDPGPNPDPREAIAMLDEQSRMENNEDSLTAHYETERERILAELADGERPNTKGEAGKGWAGAGLETETGLGPGLNRNREREKATEKRRERREERVVGGGETKDIYNTLRIREKERRKEELKKGGERKEGGKEREREKEDEGIKEEKGQYSLSVSPLSFFDACLCLRQNGWI